MLLPLSNEWNILLEYGYILLGNVTFDHPVLLRGLEVVEPVLAVGQLAQAATQLPALVILRTIVRDVQELQR